MTRAERRLRTLAPELHAAVVEAHELLVLIWTRSVMPSAVRTVILRLEAVLKRAAGEAP